MSTNLTMEQKLHTLAGGVPALIHWFRANARPLPWRQDPTPYHIWVSEIMLQQTRSEAVIPYYQRFLQALPTIAHLAAAPEDLLLKLWEGLGYYNRVRNLQKAAIVVMERYGGQLPGDYEALLSLPGIGEYTAGAIGSMAFGLPVPAVDGNVLRVMARLLCCEDDVLQPAVKRRFTDWIRQLMPADQPGAFNQGLMELGERICLPNTTPKCDLCPMAEVCFGHREGKAAELPVRSPKKERRIQQKTVILYTTKEAEPRVLLRRRPGKGLLAGLWELPHIEGHQPAEAAWAFLQQLGARPGEGYPLEPGRHVFTHIEWHMIGYRFAGEPFLPPEKYRLVSLAGLSEEYAVPTAFRPFAQLLPVLLQPKQG